MTPAAVSQQIKALEEYLQIPVLRRSGRKVELTPEGAKLLPGVQSGLDSLVAILRETRMNRASGIINISTLSSLMQKWLTPRLHRLHSKYPELRVDLAHGARSRRFRTQRFPRRGAALGEAGHARPRLRQADGRVAGRRRLAEALQEIQLARRP